MKHHIVIASIVVAGWVSPAWSQEAPPTTEELIAAEIARGAPAEAAGVEGSKLGAISLEAFFAAMKGNEMRAREVVLQPGGRLPVHGHDTRPAIAFVIEGEFVEHHSGSEDPIIRRQGDTFFEDKGLVHWSENLSSTPVRVFVVDILPSAPK